MKTPPITVMTQIGEFTRQRSFEGIRVTWLSWAAAFGFWAALIYTLLNIFPLPATSLGNAPSQGSCGEVTFWFIKNSFGFAACLGNFVTWIALKRAGEIVNPWVFLHSAQIGMDDNTLGVLRIAGNDHGYGKHIKVRLRRFTLDDLKELAAEGPTWRDRFLQKPHEHQISKQFDEPTVTQSGDIVLRPKGMVVPPFFVEVSREALF